MIHENKPLDLGHLQNSILHILFTLGRKVRGVSAGSHSRAVHNGHVFVNRNSENRLSG